MKGCRPAHLSCPRHSWSSSAATVDPNLRVAQIRGVRHITQQHSALVYNIVGICVGCRTQNINELGAEAHTR